MKEIDNMHNIKKIAGNKIKSKQKALLQIDDITSGNVKRRKKRLQKVSA